MDTGGWRTIATTGITMAAAYWLIVLFLDESVAGIRFRLGFVLPALILIAVGTWTALGLLLKADRIGRRGLVNIGILTMTVVGAFLIMDIGATVHRNWRMRTESPAYRLFWRETEPTLWMEEFLPREYYPTEANFKLHKPRSASRGLVNGPHYSPLLAAQLPAAPAVFLPRRLSFSIDEHGFRETTPLAEASVFALGDSFTFGYGVDQQESWVERVETTLGVPVYNLGVGNTSPGQQVMLLRYVLRKQPHPFHMKQLLWMIFEGNDLEDSYEPVRPGPDGASLTASLLQGTLLDSLVNLPYVLKAQSVVDRFRNGNPSNGPPFGPPKLYHSSRHGDKLFYDPSSGCTAKPKAYFERHPNRPRLEDTFRHMAALAQEFRFNVMVAVAPCEDRVYGPYFDGFPPIAEGPHFIDLVLALSEAHGFRTVNLLPELERRAADELLYARDDPHWTPRGHAIVAEVIAAAMHNRSATSF